MATLIRTKLMHDFAEENALVNHILVAPRSVPSHGHFLKLPRELRNRIYEFALDSNTRQLFCRELYITKLLLRKYKVTAEDTIAYYEFPLADGFKRYEIADVMQEANQLRYASRQLSIETKGSQFNSTRSSSFSLTIARYGLLCNSHAFFVISLQSRNPHYVLFFCRQQTALKFQARTPGQPTELK
jgi:hypothetical protein